MCCCSGFKWIILLWHLWLCSKIQTITFAFVKGPLMGKTDIVFVVGFRVHLDKVNVKNQGVPVRVHWDTECTEQIYITTELHRISLHDGNCGHWHAEDAESPTDAQSMKLDALATEILCGRPRWLLESQPLVLLHAGRQKKLSWWYQKMPVAPAPRWLISKKEIQASK